MKLNLRNTILIAGSAIVILLAWTKPLDATAHQYVDDGLKRALVTFATARAINGLISVAKQTTFSFEPFGIGTAISPGQILDPIDELVEQFSAVMLIACVSFGIQKLLITIGGLWWISAGLTGLIIGWLLLRWKEQAPASWLMQVLALFLFVRFAVPIAALGSEAVFRLALADSYKEAQLEFDVKLGDTPGSEVIGKSPPPFSFKELWDRGLTESTKEWLKQKRQELGAYLDRVKSWLDEKVKHVITLAGIFVLQTLIIPLVFLWLVQRSLRQAIRSTAVPTST